MPSRNDEYTRRAELEAVQREIDKARNKLYRFVEKRDAEEHVLRAALAAKEKAKHALMKKYKID